MDHYQDSLKLKISNRSAKVAVIGLGYVGLPLATNFAEAGFTVTGVELDVNKVQALQQARSYIQDVSSEQVARLVEQGKLKATSDFTVLSAADAVSICVPTPLRKTGDPDLSYIISATEELAKHMHPEMVIVLPLRSR